MYPQPSCKYLQGGYKTAVVVKALNDQLSL